ncbi:Modification methylase HaeIII [Ascidiaceihabitans donghaensis]|uniref:Cytosine-specific methyltransferase n=1 Tax=Ascidiaceihabitans donghaensis TaxID=1510460 RepID=A0A2R8BC54_9RHOB|nr:DNA cytosine methyltransferase [Ascidiaceihabitans donghaensis]SPH20654.1 Modification methylase HaeIII [Ascidiaceihabitans donghaensis]
MKIVDLFCGCGGFSLGAQNAGFETVLSVDVDPILTSSYRKNFPSSNLKLQDVGGLSGLECIGMTRGNIDGIIGGPPCQGFSSIGKRDSDDPRRSLLGHFFRIVEEVQPKFFVMENVKGILHGHSSELLFKGIDLVKDGFDLLGPIVLDAADFGAATKRPRVFVIGFRKDLGVVAEKKLLDDLQRPPTTVRDAISDLVNPTPVAEERGGFEIWQADRRRKLSPYASNLVTSDRQFSGNALTKHTDAVLKRFSTVEQGKTDKVGRHPRLNWLGQAPTLRAGTGSDKGSFQSVRPIHPEQHRVITVREAARLQGFPDHFDFHPTVWHSFRMIGNSVSPILSEAVLRFVRTSIEQSKVLPKRSIQPRDAPVSILAS